MNNLIPDYFKGSSRTALVFIFATLLTACADDDFADYTNSDGRIAFCMDSADRDGADTRSRMADTYQEHSPLILTDTGKDTLYLHTYVSENTAPKEQPPTRGVPVNAGNLKAVYGSFNVSAYLGAALYIDHADVSHTGNSVWMTADSHYWPDNRTLDFYAYAPSVLPDGVTGLSMGQQTISFDYTTPRNSGEGHCRDAEAQQDILFASSSLCRADAANGMVPLRFRHALAGIKFVAGDIAGGTIRTISIKNVFGNGRCVFNPAGQQDAVFSWTFPDDASATEIYRQDFNVKVVDSGSGSQPVTDSSAETLAMTFMMIPQMLGDDASIEVTVETDNDGLKTLTGSIGGNGIHAWEAGRLYTYTISTSSVNWKYTFDVTREIELNEGHVQSAYQVTSYRTRINNPSVVEPVAWEAAPIAEATAQDRDLTVFTYSGNGAADAVSYPLKCRPLDLLESTWPGDNMLRNAPSQGTPDHPYDLSTKGGMSSRNTANCYMVHAPGTYRIPLVYGNAIKDGVANPSAYSFGSASGLYLSNFVGSGGKAIVAPWLSDNGQTPDGGRLLWQDAIDVIRDVRLSDDRRYLIFTVNRTNLVQSNAVVAVTDTDGTILWSWHIWVTEYDPDTAPGLVVALDDYSDNTRKHRLFTKQLGWCDAKTLTYKGRDTEIRFSQLQSGKTADLIIRQTEYISANDVNNGTYYQWGRKDPVVGICSYDDAYSVKRYYDTEHNPHDSFDDGGLTYVTGRCSIAEAIANPCKIFCGAQHWVNAGSQYRNLWNNTAVFNLGHTDYSETHKSVKTVYDPTPAGFRMPDAFTFRIFSRQGKNVHTSDAEKTTLSLFESNLNGLYDVADKYRYTLFSQKNGSGQTVELVGTGVRYYMTNASGWRPGYVMNPTYAYTWISNGYDFPSLNSDLSYSFSLGVQPGKEVAIWVGKGEDKVSSSMSRPVYCVVDD